MSSVGFVSNYISPLWRGTRRMTSDYASFVFGVERNDRFAKSLGGSIYGVKDAKTGVRSAGEGLNNFGANFKKAWSGSKSKKTISMWSTIKKNFTNIPKEFNAARRLVAKTGKTSKYFGSTLKMLGKRMPLIGNVMLLVTEAPNLYRAFTQGGIGTGAAEVGKTAAKVGGFAAGAAIGQALIPIPFVGAVIGGMVGGWLTSKIVGKSFTEKQEEAKAEEEKQNKMQQHIKMQSVAQNSPQGAASPAFNGGAGQGEAQAYNPFIMQQVMQRAQSMKNPFDADLMTLTA